MASVFCTECGELLGASAKFCSACGTAVELMAVVPSTIPRRYELDALRSFAMLLGIVLHAAIPFVPYWKEGDSGGELLMGLVEFIHGFRMPLFFILSGFFTTMLWRHRGLQSLTKQRLRRVALPLLIGVFTILPLVIAGLIGGYVLSGAELDAKQATGQYTEDVEGGAAAKDSQVAPSKDAEKPFGFAHMWFLWFLLWMLPGFLAIAAIVSWFAHKRGRGRPIPARVITMALWVVPALAFFPQNAMAEPIFGPDTSDAFIPKIEVLAYYVCFFAFGALVYDRNTRNGDPFIESLGRYWYIQLIIGTLVLFPVGQWLIDENWGMASMVQVAFAWTVSFGFIGLFRQCMSGKNFRVRWLSDASYWMYLAHLPLVFVAQGVVSHSPLPTLGNFVLICVTVTALLLLSYRYLVRYSLIGTFLNGTRTRIADNAQRSALATASTRPVESA